MLQNLELNWLQKNYKSVETNDTIRKSMVDYTLEDWQSAVTSISFDDVKSFSKAIGILVSLKTLKTIDFHDYDSDYEITFGQYGVLEEMGISVVLNHRKTYEDYEINYIMHEAQIDLLNKKRADLFAEIESIDARIHDLGC